MSKQSAAKIVPASTLEFLKSRDGRRITFDRRIQPEMEVEFVEFYTPSQLLLTSFKVRPYEYYQNYRELGDHAAVDYAIPGVSLIRSCNDYCPNGILIYIPDLDEFGTWDGSHLIIRTFPGVSWLTIQCNLSLYANAQWYAQLVPSNPLRPWVDSRCKNIKATRAK